MMGINSTVIGLEQHLHQVVAMGFISILTSPEWEKLYDMFEADAQTIYMLRIMLRLDVYFAIRRHVSKKFISSIYSGYDDKLIEISCAFDTILNREYDQAIRLLSVARIETNDTSSFPEKSMSVQFNGFMIEERSLHYTAMMHAVACTWILNMYYPGDVGKYTVTDKLLAMEPRCESYVDSILANYSRVQKHAAIFVEIITSNIAGHLVEYIAVARELSQERNGQDCK
jgi:hypothetical protein